LNRARDLLVGSGDSVIAALENLEHIAELASRRLPDVTLHFDLAELRGYQYQTGVVFAAFVADRGQEIARGGRYDDIGKVFGVARPATGFSTDLRTLMELGKRQWPKQQGGILAPADDAAVLAETIMSLRAKGEIVIQQLPGQAGNVAETGCDRVLQWDGSQWMVKSLGA